MSVAETADWSVMRHFVPILVLAALMPIASCKRGEEHHGLVKAVAKGQSAPTAEGSGSAANGSGAAEIPVPPADSPYIGLWEQSSQTERRSMRIRFNLTGDGLFMADGSIEANETGEQARITIHGRWFVTGDAVLMRVEATDQPGVFAPSSVHTYAKSAVKGGAWSYTDGAGRARTMKRVGGSSQADASSSD